MGSSVTTRIRKERSFHPLQCLSHVMANIRITIALGWVTLFASHDMYGLNHSLDPTGIHTTAKLEQHLQYNMWSLQYKKQVDVTEWEKKSNNRHTFVDHTASRGCQWSSHGLISAQVDRRWRHRQTQTQSVLPDNNACLPKLPDRTPTCLAVPYKHHHRRPPYPAGHGVETTPVKDQVEVPTVVRGESHRPHVACIGEGDVSERPHVRYGFEDGTAFCIQVCREAHNVGRIGPQTCGSNVVLIP